MVAALAAARLGIQLHALAAPIEWVATSLTIDDTYYYLQTAWNHAQSGQPTFDGIHRTNGVQFLWYWWAVGLAYLSPSREALLLLSLLSCAALNASCFLFLWRIARFTGQPVLAAVASLAWFQASGAAYLSGMENSLHALLLLWLIDTVIRSLAYPEAGKETGRRAVGVAILCTLVVWARLDSALVVVPLFLLLIYHLPARNVTTLGPPILTAILGAGVMFGGYVWMAGTAIPVSGLVKTADYRIDPAAAIELLRSTLPLADPLANYGGGFTTVLLGIVCFVTLGRWTTAGRGVGPVVICGQALAIFLLAGTTHLLYVSGLWESNYSMWYRSPAILSMTLAGAAGLDMLGLTLRRRIPGWPGVVMVLGALGMLAVAGLYGSYTIAKQEWRGTRHEPDDEQVLRYRTAEWIRLNLPGDVILAAENTGVLAYFSERRSINLDGLINSPEFARTVIGRDARGLDDRMIAYLERERVDYLVDIDQPDWARVRWPRADITPRLPRAYRTLEGTGISGVATLEVLDLEPFRRGQ